MKDSKLYSCNLNLFVICENKNAFFWR